MTETTNYRLKKPAPEDFYDIGDQNANMDAIDAALKDHNDALERKAELGENGIVPEAQLPAFSKLALGETEHTAYRGDRGKAAYDHISDGVKHVTASERTAWNGKLDAAEKGAANGVAPLGADGKVPDGYLNAQGGLVAQEAAPENQKLGWIDTGNGNILKFYDGEKWAAVNAVWG